MRLIPVAAADVDGWAEEISWHLDSFCRSGRQTPEGLLTDCREKRRQMWIAHDGAAQAVVLTMVADDEIQTLVLTHAAGRDMGRWVHLFPLIEDWGRSIGCKRFEAICRPGWERFLKSKGMVKTHVVMEGDL